MNAQAMYQQNANKIAKALEAIEEALANHAKEQANNPQMYSFAGDLEYVAEQLQEIASFLTK